MIKPEKITIIEGLPPIFEPSPETWLPGIPEGPSMFHVAMCRVRTLDGQALVDRCYRAWRKKRPVHLEYRARDGLTRSAQILGARNVEVDEGDLLLLWVRLSEDDVEIEYDFSDDDFFDDDFDDPELPDLPF